MCTPSTRGHVSRERPGHGWLAFVRPVRATTPGTRTIGPLAISVRPLCTTVPMLGITTTRTNRHDRSHAPKETSAKSWVVSTGLLRRRRSHDRQFA